MLNLRRKCFRLQSGRRFVRFRFSYLSTFIVVVCLACLVSYFQPFGFLYAFRHIFLQPDVDENLIQNFVEQHKKQQKIAFHWLNNVSSPLISSQTNQSRFYDFLHWNDDPTASYKLFERPKRNSINKTTNEILISILYGRREMNRSEGKFYIGQVLFRLLKNLHSRFIVTLCENENTDEMISEDINVIRRLLPVFIINTTSSSSPNPFEREKEAHVQCILANFHSFPNVKYFLLLQDDAEPINDDFYSRLSTFIDQRIEHRWSSDDVQRSYPGFVKIYHPRWLIDYFHPSIYIVTQLFATSLFLTFIIWICLDIYQTRNNKNFSNRRRTSRLFTSFSFSEYPNDFNDQLRLVGNLIYCFILTMIVLILLNHTKVSWSWRSIHPTFYSFYSSPSCCLPGVLLFRSTYQQIVEHLQKSQCTRVYAIDMALDDIPRKTGLQTFLIEPNLVHHIGLYSRLRHSYIRPQLLD